jgi:hypothetical protein
MDPYNSMTLYVKKISPAPLAERKMKKKNEIKLIIFKDDTPFRRGAEAIQNGGAPCRNVCRRSSRPTKFDSQNYG